MLALASPRCYERYQSLDNDEVKIYITKYVDEELYQKSSVKGIIVSVSWIVTFMFLLLSPAACLPLTQSTLSSTIPTTLDPMTETTSGSHITWIR